MSEGKLLSTLEYLSLQRLWTSGNEINDYSPLYNYSVQDLLKYGNLKPLEHWEDKPFLFLIGQAGSGKSEYLKKTYSNQTNYLYIDLKVEQDRFISFIQNSEKWKNFINNHKNIGESFTLILDGWDELVQEYPCRIQFLSLLATIPHDLRRFINVRISSRPELPEIEILEHFQRECSWLINTNTSENDFRITLCPLCREQSEKCFRHFTNEDASTDFINWCINRNVLSFIGHIQTLIFLIRAYRKKTKWNTLTDLWEAIVSEKVEEISGRERDRSRIPDPFPSAKRLDALGDIALYYLLTGRNPIPHPNNSNNIFGLPAFSSLKGSHIAFLLSCPIFTPGGVGNILFAQAQEAEFLAARRLKQSEVNFDNIKRLLISKGRIPTTLRGLSKWVALYDDRWLVYLSEILPEYAVISLNSIQSEDKRNKIILKWWTKIDSSYQDWFAIQHVFEMLPNEKPEWIEIEIISLVESKENSRLNILLHLANKYKLTLLILDKLEIYLSLISDEAELYTGILKTLNRNSHGKKAFWVNVSKQDLTYKGGERIPAVVKQLQKHNIGFIEISKCFAPISEHKFCYEYLDFLYDFFYNLSEDNYEKAVDWRLVQEKRSNLQYSWMNRATEGLFTAFIDNKYLPGLLLFAAYAWENNHSLLSLFSNKSQSDYLKEQLLEIGFIDALFTDVGFLEQYSKKYYFDRWIMQKFSLQKIIFNYKKKVQDNIELLHTELIIHLIRIFFSTEDLAVYLEDLLDCKEILTSSSLYNTSELRVLLGPWKFTDDISIKGKQYFENEMKYSRENERLEYENKNRTDKQLEILNHEIKKVPEYTWGKIYTVIRYGNAIINGHATVKDSFLHEIFWETHLKPQDVFNVLLKAEAYIKKSIWAKQWDTDFCQEIKNGKRYTIHDYTAAPNLAWKMIWYEKGESNFCNEFKDINKKVWIKYFWGFYGFHFENLSDSQWSFLLKNLEANELTEIWGELNSLQDSGVRIPPFFASSNIPSVNEFVKNILKQPFIQSEYAELFREYISINGNTFLSEWFDFWLENQNKKEDIVDLEGIVFLLKYTVKPAWEWLLSNNNNKLTQKLLKEVHFDSFGNYQLINWPLNLLVDVVIVIYRSWPPNTDPVHEGVYSPGWRDGIAGFRNKLLKYILDHKNFELENDYIKLKESIPDFDKNEYIRDEAEQKRANESIFWGISDISNLITSKSAVIIKDDLEFTQWVGDLLAEFGRSAINGEYPLSMLLWDEYKPDNTDEFLRVPKHEDALSNLIIHWLRWRTNYINILGTRENPIILKSPKNIKPSEKDKGKRVDIDLKFPQNPKLRTIIEVKKSTNGEWRSKGLNQLKDYLDNINRKSGIYFVGKFDRPKMSKEKMLKILNDNVKPINEEGYNIIPIVIVM